VLFKDVVLKGSTDDMIAYDEEQELIIEFGPPKKFSA